MQEKERNGDISAILVSILVDRKIKHLRQKKLGCPTTSCYRLEEFSAPYVTDILITKISGKCVFTPKTDHPKFSILRTLNCR